MAVSKSNENRIGDLYNNIDQLRKCRENVVQYFQQIDNMIDKVNEAFQNRDHGRFKTGVEIGNVIAKSLYDMPEALDVIGAFENSIRYISVKNGPVGTEEKNMRFEEIKRTASFYMDCQNKMNKYISWLKDSLAFFNDELNRIGDIPGQSDQIRASGRDRDYIDRLRYKSEKYGELKIIYENELSIVDNISKSLPSKVNDSNSYIAAMYMTAGENDKISKVISKLNSAREDTITLRGNINELEKQKIGCNEKELKKINKNIDRCLDLLETAIEEVESNTRKLWDHIKRDSEIGNKEYIRCFIEINRTDEMYVKNHQFFKNKADQAQKNLSYYLNERGTIMEKMGIRYNTHGEQILSEINRDITKWNEINNTSNCYARIFLQKHRALRGSDDYLIAEEKFKKLFLAPDHGNEKPDNTQKPDRAGDRVYNEIPDNIKKLNQARDQVYSGIMELSKLEKMKTQGNNMHNGIDIKRQIDLELKKVTQAVNVVDRNTTFLLDVGKDLQVNGEKYNECKIEAKKTIDFYKKMCDKYETLSQKAVIEKQRLEHRKNELQIRKLHDRFISIMDNHIDKQKNIIYSANKNMSFFEERYNRLSEKMRENMNDRENVKMKSSEEGRTHEGNNVKEKIKRNKNAYDMSKV